MGRFSRYLRTLGWCCLPKAVLGKVMRVHINHRMRPEGIRHPVAVRVPSTDLYAYEKIFKDKEYASENIINPEVIVDAGANVGFASVFFANRYPSARILAIEPEPSNYRQLVLNTKPYHRVKCIQGALWHEEGSANLFNPCEGNLGFMLDRAAREHAHVQIAPTTLITIPRLIESEAIERINLLKIDIEGSELGVLENSAPWIERVDVIVAELHEELAPGCTEAWKKATQGFSRKWRSGENEFAARH